MKISIRTTLDYDFPQPTDVILQIEAAALPEQTIEKAWIDLSPVEHFARLPAEATIGDRLMLRLQGKLKVDYTSTMDIQRLCADIGQLNAVKPHMLPAETIPFMLPSRYCPSDQFLNIVESEFGNTQGGSRVMAIHDWISSHITYQAGVSDASTDAMQTYIDRQGVCRDFAHLMIAMVRASAIPARFASVYAPDVTPQDFHAVPEVFLDNAWYLLDPTGMAKPEEMAKMGIGRDAADVSFLTSYGPAIMNSQTVTVERA